VQGDQDQLAAGFAIGRTTAWRYVNETVDLLAARAPKLRKAVRDAKRAGHAYVILDGTLIAIDRVAADRPSYSGYPDLAVMPGVSGRCCMCGGGAWNGRDNVLLTLDFYYLWRFDDRESVCWGVHGA